MSLPDTIFIFALALVIFGPKKMPEIGRQIGKLMFEFRRASNEFKLQIEEELRAAEAADRKEQAARQISAPPPAAIAAPESPEPLTVRPPDTGPPVSAGVATATAAPASELVPLEADAAPAEDGMDLNGLGEPPEQNQPAQNQPVEEPVTNNRG